MSAGMLLEECCCTGDCPTCDGDVASSDNCFGSSPFAYFNGILTLSGWINDGCLATPLRGDGNSIHQISDPDGSWCVKETDPASGVWVFNDVFPSSDLAEVYSSADCSGDPGFIYHYLRIVLQKTSPVTWTLDIFIQRFALDLSTNPILIFHSVATVAAGDCTSNLSFSNLILAAAAAWDGSHDAPGHGGTATITFC